MSRDYGIKYSIPQKSLNKKDPNDIGFSSLYDSLKTFINGITGTTAAPGATTTISVAHALGYRPGFNAYFRDTKTGEVYQCASGFEDTEYNRSGAEINVHARVDNISLTFDIWNNAATSKNVDIFYEIFYNDLTLEPPPITGFS